MEEDLQGGRTPLEPVPAALLGFLALLLRRRQAVFGVGELWEGGGIYLFTILINALSPPAGDHVLQTQLDPEAVER